MPSLGFFEIIKSFRKKLFILNQLSFESQFYFVVLQARNLQAKTNSQIKSLCTVPFASLFFFFFFELIKKEYCPRVEDKTFSRTCRLRGQELELKAEDFKKCPRGHLRCQ